MRMTSCIKPDLPSRNTPHSRVEEGVGTMAIALVLAAPADGQSMPDDGTELDVA